MSDSTTKAAIAQLRIHWLLYCGMSLATVFLSWSWHYHKYDVMRLAALLCHHFVLFSFLPFPPSFCNYHARITMSRFFMCQVWGIASNFFSLFVDHQFSSFYCPSLWTAWFVSACFAVLSSLIGVLIPCDRSLPTSQSEHNQEIKAHTPLRTSWIPTKLCLPCSIIIQSCSFD